MPRKGRTHDDVEKYKTEYDRMLREFGIPRDHIIFYGDPVEILQSEKILINTGFIINWVGGPSLEKINVHLDIESLKDPKKTYEVKALLYKSSPNFYHTDYSKFKHSCKESDFLEEYRHRGFAKSPCHHKIAARKVIERYITEWCERRNLPEIEITKQYPKILKNNYDEMWNIINTSKLKSVPLRRELYNYCIKNHVKLYGAEIA